MRLLWLAMGVILLWFESAPAGNLIVIGRDGSIRGPILAGSSAPPMSVTVDFALPRVTPHLRSEEKGGALQTTWITNGVKYVQTVLITTLPRNDAATSGVEPLVPVLLIRIEGENSNTEYTEATAELAIHSEGSQQELQLKNGLVWQCNEPSSPIAALEIPDSGIRVASGRALKFSGNMPPSIKGSMVLKIPVRGMGPKTAEYLAELDFEEELRRISKVNASEDPSQPKLAFAEKVEVEVGSAQTKPGNKPSHTP